jgi:predicted amidohydrolase YtcJ
LKKTLFYNGRIHTQAAGLTADSMAVNRGAVVAVGANLQHDPEFSSYLHFDLKGKCILPGLVDAHTHFFNYAQTLGCVSLDGMDSLDKCLRRIRGFAETLPARAWVVGMGYSPDHLRVRTEPNRRQLDTVTGGRPAFIFYKDLHSACANTSALQAAGITAETPDPVGGVILRDESGHLTGVLRETPAYSLVWNMIPKRSKRETDRLFRIALDHAWRKGITGVHSMDGPEAFAYLADLAERNKLGIRITYYPSASLLPQLEKAGTRYGTGTEFFRIAGVKAFADGSLGSQTAWCFNKYIGSKANYGMEEATVAELVRLIKRAGRLGLPCAIHAIGDRAISNVLDAFEIAPAPKGGTRHRIEHLQLVRRKDLLRVKRLGVVASMQPSHCPSDTNMIRKYWGDRGRNAFVFRTILDMKIDLAFGSDVPVEPLDPIAGIAAAVRRAKNGGRDVFCPEQRITAAEAIHAFTVGAAIACGQQHCRGYLLPGYPADFIILDQDITRIAPNRIADTQVLATAVNGDIKYSDQSLSL